jgi:hypothetical protein
MPKNSRKQAQNQKQEQKQSQKPKTMWHPSFFASLKLELNDYRDYLEFLNEFNLNEQPRRIDVIIIILRENIKIDKNIARIFKKHNVFEYKSPDDRLTENDYYNGLSYALQYKAINRSKVSIDELTMSFVCLNKPVRLLSHLRKRGHNIINVSDGVYYIKDHEIPVQIIVSIELPEDENLFLRSLRKGVEEESIDKLFQAEEKGNLPEDDYSNFMDVVAKANIKNYTEVAEMRGKWGLDALEPEEREIVKKKIIDAMVWCGLDKDYEAREEEALRAKEEERRAKEAALEEIRRLRNEIKMLKLSMKQELIH